MADEVEPTVEAPSQPQVKPTERSQEELAAILSELDAAGVNTPQELAGKFEASRQAGQTANLLGDVRVRLNESENRVRELEEVLSKVSKPEPQTPIFPQYDEYGQPVQQPVDIEGAVARALQKEREIASRQAAEQQAKFNATWSAITNDKDFPKVKDTWEEKMKDPIFVNTLTSGKMDPILAYRNIVDEFKDGLIEKFASAVNIMRGSNTLPKPPNMESTQTPAAPEVDISEEHLKVKNLQEKALSGKTLSEEERLDALDALIPSGFLDG